MRYVLLILVSGTMAYCADAPVVTATIPTPLTAVVPVSVVGKAGYPVILTGPAGATWEAIGKGSVSVLGNQCFVIGDCVVICHADGPSTVYAVSFGDVPVPPIPVPPNPVPPVDTLAKKIADAWAEDDRLKPEAKQLASFYRAAAVKAKDTSVVNFDQLRDALANAVNTGLGSQLMTVRKLISAECKAISGDTAKPFTAEGRAATVLLFERAAAALDALAQ